MFLVGFFFVLHINIFPLELPLMTTRLSSIFFQIFFFLCEVGKTTPKPTGKAVGTFTQIFTKAVISWAGFESFFFRFFFFTRVGKGVLSEMLKAFSVSERLP